MYIERVPNRTSPPAILLREAYREDGKVKKRTLLNLSKWPAALVDGLRTLLRGGVAVERLEDAFDVERSLPHGHVAAVLGTLRRVGLDRMIGAGHERNLRLVLAMIAARLLFPDSKLATARGLREESLASSLGAELGVEEADEDELYAAMDWLQDRQADIETQLARRHFHDGALVLYDVSSTYFEGRTCPLAKLGHNRDGKKGKLQIVFGLLCTKEGCPVAVEVFAGNTGDPTTLSAQISKVRERFGLTRVIWVADRGLLTEARLREELRPVEGLEWITALRAPQIQELVQGGSLQLTLFDERDLGEISNPRYPGERLIVCKNPFLAEERARKREDLLTATQRELDKIVKATQRPRRPLRGKDQIGLRVGKVLGQYKVGKHFEIEIQEEGFSYERDLEAIRAEAALDGLYVVRTSVGVDDLSAEQAVGAYKGLSEVERAFRSIKTVDLHVRPIHHRLETRVRAHVFLCMLAYYVEWHMRQALAPILFDEDDPKDAAAKRASIVGRARRSDAAQAKAAHKRTDDDLPVHSFQSLLTDLATIAKQQIRPRIEGAESFEKTTLPTPVQKRALELLSVRL